MNPTPHLDSTHPQARSPRAQSPQASTRTRRQAAALIVHTGDGKGKTTAAMGLALRAWHQGWRIGIFQFVKSGRWRVGEAAALEALGRVHEATGEGGSVTWTACGLGRTTLRPSVDADDPAAGARAAWEQVQQALTEQRFDFIVLDEFTYPLRYGWVDVPAAVAALNARPGVQHVVVTGRGAPRELLEAATLVTRMGKVKHPFDQGQRGQAGIEW